MRKTLLSSPFFRWGIVFERGFKKILHLYSLCGYNNNNTDGNQNERKT